MRQPESNPAQPEPKEGMPVRETLDALIDLLAQVDKFCEEQGEADFETGRARKAVKAALATPPSPEPQPKTEKAEPTRWKIRPFSDSAGLGLDIETDADGEWVCWADIEDAWAAATAQASDRDSRSRIERLKAAVEGECDGLAISDEQARAIIAYFGAPEVDKFSAPAASTAEPLELPLLPKAEWLADAHTHAWSAAVIVGWPKRNAERYTNRLFTSDQMHAYAREAVRAAREEWEFCEERNLLRLNIEAAIAEYTYLLKERGQDRVDRGRWNALRDAARAALTSQAGETKRVGQYSASPCLNELVDSLAPPAAAGWRHPHTGEPR